VLASSRFKTGELQKSPKCILRGLFNFAENLLSAVVGVSIEYGASSVTRSEHDNFSLLQSVRHPRCEVVPPRMENHATALPVLTRWTELRKVLHFVFTESQAQKGSLEPVDEAICFHGARRFAGAPENERRWANTMGIPSS